MVLPYLVDKTISLSTRSPTLDGGGRDQSVGDPGVCEQFYSFA
jgi:hypothetical protein